MLRRAFLAGMAALALGASAASAETPKEINFGIISTESTQNLKTQWEPFLADMEKATGIKVNPFYATDYAGVIEAMRFNKVQVAWYGNASAIQAVDRANGEVFAQKIYADGSRGYYSILIANTNSNINSLDDVLKQPGKLKFGNGDPNSTSGFLIPSYYAWAKNNIDIRKHFTTALNSNHEANLMAVATGQVDVATNNTEDFAKFQRAQPDKAKLVREIWRSPMIPADPLVWRTDLDEGAKKKILAFLLAYGQPGPNQAHEKEVLDALGQWGGFLASSNDQLLPVRQVSLFKDRMKIEQDATISDADKKKQIAEIDAKLDELSKKMAEVKTQ
ncbi:MAG TPA: phosphonate ABC transporter substrate-binding protein [Hypericibacter adhaerens]|uniref:Phosphonates-binding periplasmic protein n=1 Tax=Hypericibacter adhaerens TaxID=2602016 RepID=A0A5J6N524_9PROT|nr:phosphonate ABC transporter substrate-binding protein [Hypericibacter adhaerens]QEX22006.1 phosphonates-binding periplasmic protein [Hypericibacter adhaerens]HWA46335.1 phosphonate ABC transporter substrate-binding protein [Hypericibacter adhaerens]